MFQQVSATRAVHLTNTTGLSLAPGRVSVFEGGIIAGQAPFPPMLPGDDELLTIGPDDTGEKMKMLHGEFLSTHFALFFHLPLFSSFSDSTFPRYFFNHSPIYIFS